MMDKEKECLPRLRSFLAVRQIQLRSPAATSWIRGARSAAKLLRKKPPSMPLSPIIRQAKVDSRQEKWVGR